MVMVRLLYRFHICSWQPVNLLVNECEAGGGDRILLCVNCFCSFFSYLLNVCTCTRVHTHMLPASVVQLDAPSDWRPGGRGFNPRRGRQHSFVEIDHEIFSTVILSLPLIQEGQLSVSGERMCTILVNRLED